MTNQRRDKTPERVRRADATRKAVVFLRLQLIAATFILGLPARHTAIDLDQAPSRHSMRTVSQVESVMPSLQTPA